jgi:deazaflavin-dependent oxidoreductase (nitroreductase family)
MGGVVERIGVGALHVHQWLYEKTDGRIGTRIGPLRTLLLRSTGRKTGQERVSALVFAMDGDNRYVVVGSNGGDDRTPGWVHNVRANPNVVVQIGRDRHDARAEIVLPDDDDYARLFKIVNDNNRYKDVGRYAHYQTLTERPIPLVVLITG